MNAVFQTEQNSPLLFAFQIKYNFGREVWERLCFVQCWQYLELGTKWGRFELAYPLHSPANLLTPGCGKGKHGVYCRAQSKENGQLMFKRPSILMAFREGFLKTQCEGGGFRAYHQLVLKSTNFVWCTGIKVKFQVSSVIWFQPIMALHTFGEQFSPGWAGVGLLHVKTTEEVCQSFISFRELGFQWLCCVAGLLSKF